MPRARDVTTARSALACFFLVGCSCEAPPAQPRPAEPVASEPSVVAEVVGGDTLPEASGGAEPSPSITIEMSARGYRVTNRALVESWPPADRERVASEAPPDQPGYPVVEVDVPLLDDGAPLLVPGVRDALLRALEAERARSGAGAPLAFSMRAPATLSWARVARAIFNAAMAGLSEPAIVVHTPLGERSIRLPRPTTLARAPGEVDLAAALRALGTGAEPTTEVEPPPEPSEVVVVVALSLEDHGLRVRRGLLELGAGCTAPATEGSPAIPLAALRDGHTLTDCLSALGDAPARFEASSDVSYGTACVVLEALARRGPVEIAVGGR